MLFTVAVAFLISFKNLSFAFTTWLFDARVLSLGLGFSLFLSLNMHSLLNLDCNTVRVEDFYVPLSIMDRSSRQKISKKILNLCILDETVLIGQIQNILSNNNRIHSLFKLTQNIA